MSNSHNQPITTMIKRVDLAITDPQNYADTQALRETSNSGEECLRSVTELISQFQLKQENLAQTKAQLQSLTNERENANLMHREVEDALNKQIEAATKEINELRNSYMQAKKDRDELLERQELQWDISDKLKTSLSAVTKERDELAVMYASLFEKKREVEQSMLRECDILEQRLNELEQKLTATDTAYKDVDDRLKIQVNLNDELRDEMEGLKASFDKTRAEYDTNLKESKQCIEDHLSCIDVLTTQKGELNAEIAGLRNIIAQLKEDNASYRSLLETMDNSRTISSDHNISDLDSQLNSNEVGIIRNEHAIEIEKLKQESNVVLQNNLKKIAHLQQHLEEAQNEGKAFEESYRNASKQYSRALNDNNVLILEIQKLKSENMKLNNELQLQKVNRRSFRYASCSAPCCNRSPITVPVCSSITSLNDSIIYRSSSEKPALSMLRSYTSCSDLGAPVDVIELAKRNQCVAPHMRDSYVVDYRANEVTDSYNGSPLRDGRVEELHNKFDNNLEITARNKFLKTPKTPLRNLREKTSQDSTSLAESEITSHKPPVLPRKLYSHLSNRSSVIKPPSLASPKIVPKGKILDRRPSKASTTNTWQ